MQHFQCCLDMSGFSDERSSRTYVYVPLARLTMKKGDIAKALEYAQRTLAASERARDEDQIAEATFVLAEIEEERENYVEAERHLERAMSIFDANHTQPALPKAPPLPATPAFRHHHTQKAPAPPSPAD